MEDKDNPPTLVFSGETNDWPAFKDAIQMRADKHDTTWLFEGGRSLAEFLARQIKEKTGSDKKVRKKALEREKVASDSNHVPTSVDAYTDDALKEWFADKDIATYCCRSTRIALRIWDRTSPTTRSLGSRTRQRSHKPTNPSI